MQFYKLGVIHLSPPLNMRLEVAALITVSTNVSPVEKAPRAQQEQNY
jgi:hypothetical protein